MSPVAYTISFSNTGSNLDVEEAIQAASDLGAVSVGRSSNERFIVIDRIADLRAFEQLRADWRSSGLAVVEPLNR